MFLLIFHFQYLYHISFLIIINYINIKSNIFNYVNLIKHYDKYFIP